MNDALRDEWRDAAVAYAQLGLRVVPVVLRGKLPTDGSGWQTARFRRNVDQVRAAWSQPHNVGILLGPESRHLADIDLDRPEALVLADEYLPGGAWVFGRANRPRSHRIYVSVGAHSITLKDLDRKELLGLRAKPEGEGHQTVFPPSVHESGERIEWDDSGADGYELPAQVDPAVLSDACRRLAVHAFLARHLGGIDQARAFLEAPQPGSLPSDVAAHVRVLAGLPPVGRPSARRTAGTGNVLEKLRTAGVEAAAALFDLGWDERRRALIVCPGCGRDTRSDHDRRAAAGVVRARTTGIELAVHGKCGFAGDAIAVAASAVLGTAKPSGREQWRKLAHELRGRGVA